MPHQVQFMDGQLKFPVKEDTDLNSKIFMDLVKKKANEEMAAIYSRCYE